MDNKETPYKEDLKCFHCRSTNHECSYCVTTTAGGITQDIDGNYVSYDPNSGSVIFFCKDCNMYSQFSFRGYWSDYKQQYDRSRIEIEDQNETDEYIKKWGFHHESR